MTKKLIQYWTHFLLSSLLKICWYENDTKGMVKYDRIEQKLTIITDLFALTLSTAPTKVFSHFNNASVVPRSSAGFPAL